MIFNKIIEMWFNCVWYRMFLKTTLPLITAHMKCKSNLNLSMLQTKQMLFKTESFTVLL